METVITMQGIFFILWTLSIYLFKRLVNDMDARIKDNETEIKEMKENYIDRFDNVIDRLNSFSKEVLEKVNSNQIELIKEISKLKKE